MLKSVSRTVLVSGARAISSMGVRATALAAQRVAMTRRAPAVPAVRSVHTATAIASKEELVHPRDAVVNMLTRIYKYKMTTTSGGNLSVMDENGDMWITPAGVDKGTLTRKDIICVHPDGSHTGPHPPSSETPFHRAIYKARPDFKAIVHAHPTSLVAYSAVRVIPETRVLHPAHQLCAVPVQAGYGCPGSQTLANHIANAFSHESKPVCVMLENHGVVVGGGSLRQAFERFETLEFTANMLGKAKALSGGAVKLLTDEQLAMVPPACKPCASGANKCKCPSQGAPALSSAEKELRLQMSTFIKRGYQQGLFISTEGSFSARLSPNAFVISAHGVDRATMDLDDFVLVCHDAAGNITSIARHNGKPPSRAAALHAKMYATHKPMGAIVNAYTSNATAFGATAVPFDTRTIPEAYLFLRDVKKVPFGAQFANNGAGLTALVTPKEPIALIENDGVIVTGKDVLHVFDRLEVLEATADALVKTGPHGTFTAMSADATKELDTAYAAFLEKMST